MLMVSLGTFNGRVALERRSVGLLIRDYFSLVRSDALFQIRHCFVVDLFFHFIQTGGVVLDVFLRHLLRLSLFSGLFSRLERPVDERVFPEVAFVLLVFNVVVPDFNQGNVLRHDEPLLDVRDCFLNLLLQVFLLQAQGVFLPLVLTDLLLFFERDFELVFKDVLLIFED